MRFTKIFLLMLVVAFFVAKPAHAVLQITIDKGNAAPLPVAVPEFAAQTQVERELSANIAQVIIADLERSGIFRPLDPRGYIETIVDSRILPQFASWRQLDASALVTGGVRDGGGGQMFVEFRLWDVFSEQQMTGREYTTAHSSWRRVAHMIADEIYSRLTGDSGYFDTRLVYVSETGSRMKRVKRLAIMDQDGANHRYLTDGSHMVLTPRFSPNSQSVLYFSYASKTPRVYLYQLETGRSQVVGDFPGMTYAPRFSPDGRSVIMSIANEGNSNIYSYDLVSRQKQRITSGPYIDTSPSYSRDSKRVVFNSDRAGSQQLYAMNADGSDIQRISFNKGKYGTPVWSPRGDWIAFTKIFGGSFYIGVMKPDGSGERLITEGFLVEGPTWSPNGRVIIYTRETKGGSARANVSKIYSIDVTGYNEREVPTPQEASDPAWSPLRSGQ